MLLLKKLEIQWRYLNYPNFHTHTHTHTHSHSLTHSHTHSLTHSHTHSLTAGTKQPIEEGKVTTVEIPKGKSELGLSYCWCEDVVRAAITQHKHSPPLSRVVLTHIHMCTGIWMSVHVLMRDEKEGRKKQARSNKQTRQSNIAHSRQSLFLRKMSCLRWDSNPRHSHVQVVELYLQKPLRLNGEETR